MADSIFEGGGGGTPAGADTEIQYNNSGAFGASSDFVFDNSTKTFKVMSSANNLLLVDAATGDYGLGDLDGIGNSTRLFIDDTGSIATIAAGGDRIRLNIDGTAFTAKIGDVDSIGNDTVLTINDTTKTIRADYGTGRYFLMQNNGIGLDNMSFSGGASVGGFILSNDDNNVTFQNGATFTIGMALDYANNVYSIGNTNAGTPTKVTIDGTNQDVSIIANKTIKATNIFGNKFILADMLNKLYKIGDIDATNNSTIITVDDAAKTIKSSGGIIKNYTAQTTTYNILRNDYTINCTSGTFTVTLPTAVGFAGQTYVIKNSGAGVITLATTSSQTIDGVTTQTLAASLSLTVTSTGANWIII